MTHTGHAHVHVTRTPLECLFLFVDSHWKVLESYSKPWPQQLFSASIQGKFSLSFFDYASRVIWVSKGHRADAPPRARFGYHTRPVFFGCNFVWDAYILTNIPHVRWFCSSFPDQIETRRIKVTADWLSSKILLQCSVSGLGTSGAYNGRSCEYLHMFFWLNLMSICLCKRQDVHGGRGSVKRHKKRSAWCLNVSPSH